MVQGCQSQVCHKAVLFFEAQTPCSHGMYSQHDTTFTYSAGGGQIDTLVLVDRTVDPLTPLCTQLTYEGLVDETLHIKNGVVQLGAEGLHSSTHLLAPSFTRLRTHRLTRSPARSLIQSYTLACLSTLALTHHSPTHLPTPSPMHSHMHFFRSQMASRAQSD